jgi:hypothetical protein
MTMGPGKYDEEATLVMERTKAKGVIVIVLGGNQGEGFSCQATLEVVLTLPAMLRDIANQLDADLPNVRKDDIEKYKDETLRYYKEANDDKTN